MAVRKIDTAVEFDIEFPRVRGWLIEALKHTTTFSEIDVLTGLARGDFDLWTSPNAACVAQITTDAEMNVCVLVLVAGAQGKALREIMIEGQSAIIEWARNNSCQRIIGTPRKEWSRLLIRDGFKVDNKNNFYKDF